MLGDGGDPMVYAAPCGMTSRSVTLEKSLNEFQGVDCDDPDAVSWLLRDGVSKSMSVDGEGVLAEESIETWLDALENVDAVPAKIELEFPTKTVTWTGNMQVGTFTFAAENGGRATANLTMQSSGPMVRTVTP
jgi:hypothetical protein